MDVVCKPDSEHPENSKISCKITVDSSLLDAPFTGIFTDSGRFITFLSLLRKGRGGVNASAKRISVKSKMDLDGF